MKKWRSLFLTTSSIVGFSFVLLYFIPGTPQDFQESYYLGNESITTKDNLFLKSSWWHSTYYKESVLSLLQQKAFLSVTLCIGALLGTYMLSSIMVACNFSARLLVIGYAFPSFLIALLLSLIFPHSLGFIGALISLILAYLPRVLSMIKSLYTQESSKPYVFVLQTKGLSSSSIFWKHLAKPCMWALVPEMIYDFIALFTTSSFVVETFFQLDGLGRLGLEAVYHRDYPLMMTFLLMYGLCAAWSFSFCKTKQ